MADTEYHWTVTLTWTARGRRRTGTIDGLHLVDDTTTRQATYQLLVGEAARLLGATGPVTVDAFDMQTNTRA